VSVIFEKKPRATYGATLVVASCGGYQSSRKSYNYRWFNMKSLLLVLVLLVSGCTTDSYIRDDGAKVTVKKFLGIPYLERDETTRSAPMGSQ
jgi:hypothetical protein